MTRPSPRRGAAALLVALALLATTGFGALVFDLGYARMVDGQLQGTADAAAHAAVSRIVELGQDADGRTAADLAAGRAMAQLVAAENRVNGHAAALGADRVQTGIWAGGAFTPSEDPDAVNAVRVQLAEPGLVAPFYSLFSQSSGHAHGASTLTESADAVAMVPPPTGAGGVACYLPIAIPSCALDARGPDGLASYTFLPGSDRSDTGGWAILGTRASASAVTSQVEACDAAGEIQEGDPVFVNNGSITNAFRAMADAVAASDTRWDSAALGPQPARQARSAVSAAAYGRTLERPLLVFEASDCSNIRFNQSYPLAGFAWGVVYDVVSQASGRAIHLRIDPSETRAVGTRPGTGSATWGVGYSAPPMLVQ